MILGKYKKKPIVIEAVRFVGQVTSDFAEVTHYVSTNWGAPWLVGNALEPDTLFVRGREDVRPDRGLWIDPADGALVIRTLEGDMKVGVGDWIIRGVAGELYPCKHEIFMETYELAEV